MTTRRLLGLLGLVALLVVPAASADDPLSITVSVSGTEGGGGWYRSDVTVTFNVAPAAATTSGSCLTSGSTSITLGGETAGATLACSATLGAQTTNTSITIKIDKTAPAVTGAAPTRGPDGADWYNHPLAVAYAGTDALSGIASCDAPTYGGPDSASASVSGGKCRDVAGNESAAGPPVGFKYDATPPAIGGGSVARDPDSGGWYNRPVGVTFSGSDGLSGVVGCSSVTYSGPDGASAAVSGTCTDAAGNSAGGSVAISYDATPPQITGATAGRPADVNGWYNHAVPFTVAATDGASGVESCSNPTYGGPDAAEASVSATCRDKAGNSSKSSFPLKYDETAPEVTGVKAERPPDGGGFYNHPVAFAFQGRDALSGLESCTTATLDGPQGQSAVRGICRDNAGNSSRPMVEHVRYDSKPPVLRKVIVDAGDGFAVITVRASKDVALVEVTRSPGLGAAKQSVVFRRKAMTFKDKKVRNGRRYEYFVAVYDVAGNATRRRIFALPRGPLYGPTPGARVKGPPLLEWLAVPHATYYNVQLYRGRTKILTAWPKGTRFRLTRTWRYGGKLQRLLPGRYVWYLWPGFKNRKDEDYGKLIGKSAFVVG